MIMKTWTNPSVEELEVKLTARGEWDAYVELSYDGTGWNNDLFTGNDSDGDGTPSQPVNPVNPGNPGNGGYEGAPS